MSAIPKDDQQQAAEEAAPDPEKWKAPEVITYGKNFSAAKIQQRRRLLGRRRAVGEVTADIGPPGVNKSMLMLTDGVSIATGRKLLSDDVHESGGVLLLVGEDGRRDVEARLAAILQHYNIKPAELRNRLHVVYLSEIENENSYTLAHMQQDIGALNVRMLEWLRAFPDVVAILIDPLVAWHHLMENSNEAMQIVWGALRSLAVRGRRHVGFDHHVTKASMLDPEAHIGNLAALRGAAIGGGVRWAFTMARLRPDTAERHGVTGDDAWRYRRLDGLKTSYGPEDNCQRLLKVESIRIANGEDVGVLVEVDLAKAHAEARSRAVEDAKKHQKELSDALAAMLAEKHPMSTSGAATWLASQYPGMFKNKDGRTPASERTIMRYLPMQIGKGVETPKGRIVIRGVGAGKGNGAAIDYRHHFDGAQGVAKA